MRLLGLLYAWGTKPDPLSKIMPIVRVLFVAVRIYLKVLSEKVTLTINQESPNICADAIWQIVGRCSACEPSSWHRLSLDRSHPSFLISAFFHNVFRRFLIIICYHGNDGGEHGNG